MKKIKLIYILGTSYSGSTILSYLLGAADNVHNLGELKLVSNPEDKGIEYCSCGKHYTKCPFWSSYYSTKNYNSKKQELAENKQKPAVQKLYSYPSLFSIIAIVFKILTGKSFKKNTRKNLNEYSFLEDAALFADTDYLVDSSKSLWRLIHLYKTENIELKVIHIKRDIKGNVASFIKHNKGFWRGIINYKLKNFLIQRFIKCNKLSFCKVDYYQLCNSTENTLAQISAFLNVDFTSCLEKVKQTNYHVLTGNKGVQQQFRTNFKGLKYDQSWKKRLTKPQKFILNYL
jgi:hypothetical protein